MPGASLDDLIREIRAITSRPSSDADTAESVAELLRQGLPGPEILTADQRRGAADEYQQHVLHVEPGGVFSIVALVWRPGQQTPIHDHISWCVVAVLVGEEHEVLYSLSRAGGGDVLVAESESHNPAGSVCGFAPPGDIHSVRNDGDDIAISLHVYGADIGARRTSILRTYDANGRRSDSMVGTTR